MTNLAMHESVDGRILKWSGVAMALFLCGALASMAGVRAGAMAHASATTAAATALDVAAPASPAGSHS